MSDGHTTAEKNNYTVTFHPAFASSCVIEGEDGKCEVYKQSKTHVFQNGDKHPKKHKIHLKGGKFDRDITIEVNDPKHAIKQIRLELYPQRDESQIGDASQSRLLQTAEVFTADNHANTCPPICTGDPGI